MFDVLSHCNVRVNCHNCKVYFILISTVYHIVREIGKWNRLCTLVNCCKAEHYNIPSCILVRNCSICQHLESQSCTYMDSIGLTSTYSFPLDVFNLNKSTDVIK